MRAILQKKLRTPQELDQLVELLKTFPIVRDNNFSARTELLELAQAMQYEYRPANEILFYQGE